MAKSKKSESSASDTGAAKKKATETKKAATHSKPAATTKSAAAAKPAATKKKASPASSGSGGGGSAVPLIDTDLAAQAAARMLISRATSGAAPSPQPADRAAEGEQPDAGEKRESSTFKQLKNSMNKPASGGLGGILGGGPAGKKGNTGFGGGNQQVGRNQTFGADVNRAGVPRRTGG